jgi:hypothetical protein
MRPAERSEYVGVVGGDVEKGKGKKGLENKKK